jgi:uncharacterized RDD family membrane protein YckC
VHRRSPADLDDPSTRVVVVLPGGHHVFCQVCGARRAENASYCTSCGVVLAAARFAVEPAAPAVLAEPPATPPAGSVGGYAGFWLRLAAWLVDWIVGVLGGIGIVLAFGPLAPLVAIPAGWLYFAAMESSTRQATLGKMALGLVVTDAQGRRLGFGRASGRYFAKLLSWLTLAVGFMVAGWTPRKQALHDLVAGTLVVRRA